MGKGLHGGKAKVHQKTFSLAPLCMPCSWPDYTVGQPDSSNYCVVHNMRYSLGTVRVNDCIELHHTAGDFSLKGRTELHHSW